MASFCRYLFVFLLMKVYFISIASSSNLSFTFKNFSKDSSFGSQLALYGDAKVGNVSKSIRISGSGVYSAGRVVCKKPLRLIEKKTENVVSFSSYFVFSMSKGNGDGLAFVILPTGFPLNEFYSGSMGMSVGRRKMRLLAIEFDTFEDIKYGDLNGNHIGIDIDSPVSVKVSNVSSIHLVLNSGEKLQAWIDYEASSKRLEVRLNKYGENRPLSPLLSYFLDLSEMWKTENVTIGFSSSSGNSSQKSNLYSWSFSSRTFPHWMHSNPMNPESFVEKGDDNVKVPKKGECGLRILVALIFGSGCGALGAFFVLFVWSMFGNRRPVVPEDFPVKPKESEFEKFNVVEKTVEDGKK